jgi:hypothetical protein
MSLELINTLGTVSTVIIIAAAAIAALVQLRHLRAGNQINAMLTIGDEFRMRAFIDADLLVAQRLDAALDDPVYRGYEIARSRNQTPPEVSQEYVALRQAAVLIGNSYEELGILVKNGIVDTRLFLDRYSWRILSIWRQLESLTALARDATQQNAIWENFEYLAVLSEDWIQRGPSTYPKGMRRMRFQNPWPVEPMAAFS